MIDLSKISGLPIELDEQTYHLKFGNPLRPQTPDVRKFDEMQAVLMDPTVRPEREELYYMYRDVHLPSDEQQIRDYKLRYDLTVIPPSMLGKEFVKTIGHYHSLVPGESFEYPEIYEVLHGQVLFMIQKIDPVTEKVVTVMSIKAVVGDKVIYPPNYGHIIVNIGLEPVVTANWVSSEYSADYKSIAARQGMAYYVLKGSNEKQFEIIPNSRYGQLPEMRFANGHMNSFGFLPDEPMYVTGMRHPGRLEFLNNPHKFAVELSTITS